MRDAIYRFCFLSLFSLVLQKHSSLGKKERKKERKKEQLNNSGEVKLWRNTHERGEEEEKKRRKKVKKKTRTTKNRSHKIQITLKKRKEGPKKRRTKRATSSVDSFVFITLCFNTCALHQNLQNLSFVALNDDKTL